MESVALAAGGFTLLVTGAVVVGFANKTLPNADSSQEKIEAEVKNLRYIRNSGWVVIILGIALLMIYLWSSYKYATTHTRKEFLSEAKSQFQNFAKPPTSRARAHDVDIPYVPEYKQRKF